MFEVKLVLVWFIGLIIGVGISLLVFNLRKKKNVEEYCGDLYIVKDAEEGILTYVVWETEPENFIDKDHVLLNVKTN